MKIRIVTYESFVSFSKDPSEEPHYCINVCLVDIVLFCLWYLL